MLSSKQVPQALQQQLLIQMSGAPGSGKSSMARLLQKSLGGLVIDHDILRSSLLEENDAAFDEVAKRAYHLQWAIVEDVIKQGLNIIVDSPCNYQSILNNGSALAEKYGLSYWFVECRVEDIDLLDERLRKRAPMKSQRTGFNCPPAVARSARKGEDSQALYKKWIKNPIRPQRNAITIDSTGNLQVQRDYVLSQILGDK